MLPDFIVALAIILFDLDVSPHILGELRVEIQEYFTFLQEDILKKRLELSEIIRVCIFLKLIWLISLDSSIKSTRFKDNFNKRITDLMRSEFSTIKWDENDPTCDIQDLVSFVINEPESLYITYIRNRNSPNSNTFLYNN